MSVLEIMTDASIRKYPNGRIFGCAGALCINTGQTVFSISQDSTNNRSELLAIYLGIKMAKDLLDQNPMLYNEVILYSDSQFGIFGLTRWMKDWVKNRDKNGVMYGTNSKPVKNQELFMCIITFLAVNNLKIKFRHCSGHVRYTSTKKLEEANQVFYRSNGYYLRPEDIYKIAYYNDIIDKETRNQLDTVNPDMYPVLDYSDNFMVMCRYCIPPNYQNYIL